MSKLLKKRMMTELEHEFRDLSSFMAFDFTGVKAEVAKEFRRECHKRRICVKVIKNRMAGRMFPPEKFVGGRESFWKGPTALVYGGESPVDIAKLLTEWSSKKNQKFKLKGGYLSGRRLNVKEIEALSKVPSKEVLLSIFASSMMAPAQKIAILFQAPIRNFVFALVALSDAMEKAGVKTVQDLKS